MAGLVAQHWSWRAVSLGLAVLTALPAAGVVPLLGKGGDGRRAAAPVPAAALRPSPAAAVAVSIGAALVQYGVSGGGPAELLCGAAGLALLLGFLARMPPGGAWRAARGLPATVLLRGLSSGAYFTLEAFVPLCLDTGRRVSGIVTGLAFTGAAIAWAAVFHTSGSGYGTSFAVSALPMPAVAALSGRAH